VLDRAVAVCRERVRLRPGSYGLRFLLGAALQARGHLDQAIAEFREVIRLKPDHVAYSNIGNILRSQGKAEEATAEFHKAIQIKPDYAEAYSNLGAALKNLRRFDEAVATFNEAIRLMPDSAIIRYNLGTALQGQEKLDEAIAAYRDAIRLKPDMDPAYVNLGVVLYEQRKIDEAVAEFRKAIRLNPSVVAHGNLGEILLAQGDYAGSLAEYRKAHEIAARDSNRRYPTAQWVAKAERLTALAEHLPELLKEKDHPKDAADCLALAKMCRDKKLYTLATRFLVAALEANRKLGDDREAPHRYDGACAAALAAAGQGKDDPPPDEAAKAKLRGQALRWLKDDLETWTRALASGPPQARSFVARSLVQWRQDTDLATIRDPEALAMLPEVERKEWQSLWADVEALLKRAQENSP
jgi:tetratricopeptide (TPR) repeat protein